MSFQITKKMHLTERERQNLKKINVLTAFLFRATQRIINVHQLQLITNLSAKFFFLAYELPSGPYFEIFIMINPRCRNHSNDQKTVSVNWYRS